MALTSGAPGVSILNRDGVVEESRENDSLSYKLVI